MKRQKHLSRFLLALAAIVVLVFLLAPIIAVIGGSFNGEGYFSFPPDTWSVRWYQAAASNEEHLSSLAHSLKVASVATLISVVLCIPASLALVKGSRKLTSFMKKIFMAPIFLPAIVWGVGMLLFFGKTNVRGSFGLLVAAHVVLVTPYLIRVVGSSLDEFNFTLEDAAISLGATPAQTFLRVTLPLISPGVVVGAVFGFMISFSELIITLFIAGSNFTTFPVRVYSEMRTEGLNPMVLAYSTIIVVVVLVISIIGEKCARWSRFFS